MKCSLCDGEIEVQRNPKGIVYWTEGHNAAPLSEGRCCDNCNITKVIPARLARLKRNFAKESLAKELEEKTQEYYKNAKII